MDKLERLKLCKAIPLLMILPSQSKSRNSIQIFRELQLQNNPDAEEVNFKVFAKLLRKEKYKSITIDIDSSVVYVEGHQEGAVKGYNPKKLGNNCLQHSICICDEN